MSFNETFAMFPFHVCLYLSITIFFQVHQLRVSDESLASFFPASAHASPP
jgi:hypothetical protein